MSMTTKNFFKTEQRDKADMGPKGAGYVDTQSEGQPSVADGADEQSPAELAKLRTVAMVESDALGKTPTQSPASLQGNVVAKCDIVPQNYGK